MVAYVALQAILERRRANYSCGEMHVNLTAFTFY